MIVAGAAKMRSPAPRVNAENRAVVIRNDNIDSVETPKPEDDFGTAAAGGAGGGAAG
jgi:hypothetical protein